MADITIKKKTGLSTTEPLYPTTTWTQVENKPTTFTPTAHTHTKSDITDFAHTHVAADITDLKAQLRWTYVYGKAQSTITKGQALQFAGVQGDHILVKPAVPSEINANPDYFVGLAETNAATNDFVYIIDKGELINVNTNAYTAGTILWYQSEGSTAGLLRTTEPSGNVAKIQIGAVTKQNETEGVILVRVNFFGVDIIDIKATGTPSDTTYLRGDGTWATVSGGGGGDFLPLTGGTLTGTLNLTNADIGLSPGYAIALSGSADATHRILHDAVTDYDVASYSTGFQFRHFEIGNQITLVGSSGNIGIGTTSPQAKLHIAGTAGTWGAGIQIEGTGTGARRYGAYVTSSGTLTLADENAALDRLSITAAGNIGIGLLTPDNQLTISQVLQFNDALDGDTTGKFAAYSYDNKFEINPRTTTGGSAGIIGLAMNTSGNIGLGTLSPSQKLDVNGNINLGGTSNIIKDNGSNRTTANFVLSGTELTITVS